MRFPILDEVIRGDTTDIYFRNTKHVLGQLGLDPEVGIKIFCREEGTFCGIKQVLQLLEDIHFEGSVSSLVEGDLISKGESVLEIYCNYSQFCIYETAILGILASSTGWATAARRIVNAARHKPVVCFGSRHIHPNVSSIMDWCAIVGGCVSSSSPLGADLAGTTPSGTMPHSFVLIVGDTVEAFRAYNKHMDWKSPRIVLVDTFKDEAEETLRLARTNLVSSAPMRLDGIRLDTPSDRGGVTLPLVWEIRERLDLDGFSDVKITVSGGFNEEKIRMFEAGNAPVDAYGVGSSISGAKPIDFTADLREIDGKPIAKRGRVPGHMGENDRLRKVL